MITMMVAPVVACVTLIIEALIGTEKGKDMLGKQKPAGFLEMVKNMMLMNEPEHSITAHQGVS